MAVSVFDPTAATPFLQISHVLYAVRAKPFLNSNAKLTGAEVSGPGGALAGISRSLRVVLGAIGWTCSPANRRLSVAGRREQFPRPARAERREAAELLTAPTD